MAHNRRVSTTFGELIADGLLEIGDGYRAKNEELGGGGPIFLRAGHVTDTHIDFAGVERFHVSLTDKVRSKMSRVGDAIVTTKGNSTGRTAFVTASMPEFVYSPHLSYWRSLDVHKLKPGFLRFWSKSAEFSEQLAGMKASTDMAPYLSLVDQRRLKITLPSPSDQDAISEILGAFEEKIELNRRMNETLETMARALFKSWFVDFDPVMAKVEGRNPNLPERLAVQFPSALQHAQNGKLPVGWRLSFLGDEVRRFGGTIQTGPFGSQLHASDYVEHGVPVIMPQDLVRRRIAMSKIARTSEGDAQRLARHRVEPGDIIYSRRGNVELHALVGMREAGWLCGTGCLLVRPGANFPSPLFVSFALDRPECRSWIVQHAIGATMPNLNTGILARVPLMMPDDALLGVFEKTVQPIAKRILALDDQAEVLLAMRDTLLPKLVSGELRVKAAEKIVEAVA